MLLKSGVATVWNKDDVIKLKKELRIPGTLVGSLPRKPWQNQVMSLPLMLMPEEVSICIDKGFAHLASKEIGVISPKTEIIEEYQALREKSHTDQVKIFVHDRESKKKQFNQKVKLKRKHSEESKECHESWEEEEQKILAKKEGKGGKEGKLEKGEVLSGNLLLEEKIHGETGSRVKEKENAQNETISDFDLQYYSRSTWIHVPTTTTNNSLLTQTNLKENLTWNFPFTMEEKCRYAVFCSLWDNGYYVTNGAKFGSDYLVYPGEPSRYHSQYIVKVMPSSVTCNPHELMAYGRLANAVKKTFVFAIVNQDDLSVKYQFITWADME